MGEIHPLPDTRNHIFVRVGIPTIFFCIILKAHLSIPFLANCNSLRICIPKFTHQLDPVRSVRTFAFVPFGLLPKMAENASEINRTCLRPPPTRQGKRPSCHAPARALNKGGAPDRCAYDPVLPCFCDSLFAHVSALTSRVSFPSRTSAPLLFPPQCVCQRLCS